MRGQQASVSSLCIFNHPYHVYTISQLHNSPQNYKIPVANYLPNPNPNLTASANFQPSSSHQSQAKMHFTTPIILSLLTFTTSLPLQQRSATTLLSDISTISGYVSTLTSDATSYTGGLLQSLGLAITVDSLESSLTTATSDATSSSTFSSTDSDSILAAITTLTPNILTLLADLDAIVSFIFAFSLRRAVV